MALKYVCPLFSFPPSNTASPVPALARFLAMAAQGLAPWALHVSWSCGSRPTLQRLKLDLEREAIDELFQLVDTDDSGDIQYKVNAAAACLPHSPFATPPRDCSRF